MQTEAYDVVVIGAGQAGLAVSYYLAQHDCKYVVLEQGRLVERWRSQRWDSFTLVTPNRFTKLPGLDYKDGEPDGFVRRDDLIRWFESYVALFNPPIHENCEVMSVEQKTENDGYVIATRERTVTSVNVVVATGILQTPNIPDFASRIDNSIVQIHTSQYRNPAQLPEGRVLIVGTGQSGCQIAEEVYKSGRKTYLCVGSNGRVPRRYRGRDVYAWTGSADINTSTVGQFSNHAHVTGRDGGYELNLHQFAKDGVVLLGRVIDANGFSISLASDLMESLRSADSFYDEYRRTVDDYIEQEGIDAPADEPLPILRDGYEAPIIKEMDLAKEMIDCIIWATGFQYDFSWVNVPVFDESGFPIQERGVTAVPGLYFVGMNWEHRPKSAFIGSVGPEAEMVSEHIVARLMSQ